jgi:hypothetical protein
VSLGSTAKWRRREFAAYRGRNEGQLQKLQKEKKVLEQKLNEVQADRRGLLEKVSENLRAEKRREAAAALGQKPEEGAEVRKEVTALRQQLDTKKQEQEESVNLFVEQI